MRAEPETASTYVVGLDIGGTKIAAGLVRFPAGEVLERRVIPTRADRSGGAVLDDTMELAGALLRDAEASGVRISGIGAGVAELVNHRGEVTSRQTIDWCGLPLAERLGRLAPALVESDVRAAALGEAHFGAGVGHHCVVYVSVGTGISHTLVIGGRPYAGANGNALILASGPYSQTCPHCGRRGSVVLEDFASGPAIARRYREKTGAAACTGEEVMRLAGAADASAVEVAETAGEALGAAIGFLVNVLDPHVIIIGGGLGVGGGSYWRSLVAAARAHIWADSSRQIPMVCAALRLDSGVVGAAASFYFDSTSH